MRWLIAFIVTLMCISCATTRYVDIPYEVKSIEYRNKMVRDSIYLKDSIYIRSMNDTLVIEKWHIRYVEKLRVDTLIKMDSVPIPYEVIVEVNKLTTFQEWIQALGYIGIGAIILLLILLGRRIIK